MENIKIASFDIDDAKVLNKLDELANQIENLNVQREKERRQLSELNKEYNSVSKEMDNLAKTGRKNSEEYTELTKKQNDLTLAIVRQKQEISDITTQTRQYSNESKQLNQILDASEKAHQLLNKAYDVENKSIDELREDRKLLIQLRNQEVAVMGEQSEQAQKLNKIIEASTNQEKKLVAESEKRFFQIGDYANQLKENFEDVTNAINKVRADQAELNKLYQKEIQVNGDKSDLAKQYATELKQLSDLEEKLAKENIANMELLNKSTSNLINVSDELQNSFGGVISAIQQIGSGDVVGGVDNLKNSFGGLVQSAKAFALTPIGAVVTGLVSIGGATKYLYDYNVEMSEAAKLTQQFTGFTGEQLENASVRVKSFANQTNTDMKEVIRTVNAVANAYGISFDEAFNKVQTGYVRAGKSAEDFFDNTDEYITQFNNAGYSADEFFSILESGASNGTYKDKIVDSIKEMDLRLKEFTKGTSDALINAFGVNFTSKLANGLAKGTITTKDALKQISDESDKIGLNFQQKQELVANVFGAMGEDAGGFVKVLDSIQDGLNNTNRDLTDLEKAQQQVIDKTNEFDQAFADLFNISGGGFETMIADLKVIGLNLLINIINKTKDIIDGFKNLYNQSMALRGGIASVEFIFKSLYNTILSVSDSVYQSMALIGNALSGNFDEAGKNLTNLKNNAKDFAKTISNDFSNAFKKVKFGSLNAQTNQYSNNNNSKTNNNNNNTSQFEKTQLEKLGKERLKQQEKDRKEAEKDLKEAQKLEQKLIEDYAKYVYDLGQDELANQIKNNAEKLKNAKVLTDAMLELQIQAYKEEQKLEQQKLDNEKKETERKLEQEKQSNLKSINDLLITEQEKSNLKLQAEQNYQVQKDLNDQQYQQKTLENERATQNAVLLIEQEFAETKKVLEQQRQEFDFQQKMLRLQNQNITEFDMQRVLLSQQYTQEMAILRDKLNQKLITERQFSEASVNLTKWENQQKSIIDRLELENKLNSYSSVLSSLSGLFEQNTAAYKLAASATAVIDTYAAANKTLKTFSGVPIPGYAIAQVVATIATGLANVIKINKVSTNSTNSASGISASASGGTTTNTYKASYAGGDTGLSGLSQLSGYNQNNTFGNVTDTTAIAEAVKEGAKEGAKQGSQDGLIGLSTNRQILNNASY